MKHLPQRTQAGAAETNFRKRSSDSQFSVLSWVPQLGEKLQSMNSGTAPGEKQNTGDFGVILLRVWKMALLYWSFKHLNDDAALFLYINFKWLNTFPKYDFLLTISFFFPFLTWDHTLISEMSSWLAHRKWRVQGSESALNSTVFSAQILVGEL